MRATLVMAVLGAGCALAGQRAAPLPPLEHEGELVVLLKALPPGAEPLEVAELFAVRIDGGRAPLEVLTPHLSGSQVKRQRLWARGRLEPGHYSGLVFVRPRAKGDAEPAQEHLGAPFSIARGHATVLQVQLSPALAASVPPRTLPQLAGYVTSSSANDVAVLDKLSRQVEELVPLGRGPWGVALDPILFRAYVALEGEDQISIVDVASGEELNRIRLNLGDAPRELALSPDRRLLLSANAGSNTVSFIDPQAMSEVARVATGEEPSSLLIDRRGQRAYVTNLRSSSITVLDLATRTAAGTLSTEDRPLRPQLDRTGNKLYVLHPASAFLLVFSLPDLAVTRRIYVGTGNSSLKVDPATDLIYLAKSGEARIAVYDPFSLIPIAGIDALPGVTVMVIDDAENALFALSPDQGAVGVLELAHRRLSSLIEVGPEARWLALMGERN